MSDNRLVDVLAEQRETDVNFDKTFFCTILKSSTGVSDTLTEEEKEQLGDCAAGWYYVRIKGTFYQLECQDGRFSIDEEVKVKVPCNNWDRMYIDFKNGTSEVVRRWVRPKDWLPIPTNIAANEAYLLVRGARIIDNSAQGYHWQEIQVFANNNYGSINTCVVNWGDNSEEETFTIGNSMSHTYQDTDWHWLKITYSLPITENILVAFESGTARGEIVEFISGGFAGFFLNYADNQFDSMEHIITGFIEGNHSSYGSKNIQCLEMIEWLNADGTPRINRGAQINYSTLGCYNITFSNDVLNIGGYLLGLSAIKKFDFNQITEMPSLDQCYNVTEIYAPNCTNVSYESLGYIINGHVYKDTCKNLKKVTLKNGCTIDENSVLNYMPWVEIKYI